MHTNRISFPLVLLVFLYFNLPTGKICIERERERERETRITWSVPRALYEIFATTRPNLTN